MYHITLNSDKLMTPGQTDILECKEPLMELSSFLGEQQTLANV